MFPLFHRHAYAKLPLVGAVLALDERRIDAADGGGVHRLRLTDDSFVRGLVGDQMPIDEVRDRSAPGDEVIIAINGDVVVNMRPQG